MKWRAVAQGLLIAYMVGLAIVLLVPDGNVPGTLLDGATADGRRAGLPEWLLLTDRFQFVANVLIVLPVTAVASGLWPSRGWTYWTAYGFVASFAVEAVQALLPGRSATFVDVVANTIGALTGAVLVALVREA